MRTEGWDAVASSTGAVTSSFHVDRVVLENLPNGNIRRQRQWQRQQHFIWKMIFFQSVTRDILGKINSECFQQAELMFFHSVIRMLYNWAIGDSSWLGHYSRSWCDKHPAVTPVGSTWNYFLPSMPASLTENFYLSFQSPGLKPTNLLSGVLFSEER